MFEGGLFENGLLSRDFMWLYEGITERQRGGRAGVWPGSFQGEEGGYFGLVRPGWAWTSPGTWTQRGAGRVEGRPLFL